MPRSYGPLLLQQVNHTDGSIPILQVHFSSNDFLGGRVRFFGIRVILRGKLGFHGRNKVSVKWSDTTTLTNLLK